MFFEYFLDSIRILYYNKAGFISDIQEAVLCQLELSFYEYCFASSSDIEQGPERLVDWATGICGLPSRIIVFQN